MVGRGALAAEPPLLVVEGTPLNLHGDQQPMIEDGVTLVTCAFPT